MGLDPRLKSAEAAFAALSLPFGFDEIEIKPQSVSKDKTKALAAPYFNARTVAARLDAAVSPENWRVAYEPVNITVSTRGKNDQIVTEMHGGFKCRLGVRVLVDGEAVWVERENAAQCTDIESLKGGLSDALKRTFADLGCRALYSVKLGWFECTHNDRGYFSGWTPNALKAIRTRYEQAMKGQIPVVPDEAPEKVAKEPAPPVEALPDAAYHYTALPDTSAGQFLKSLHELGLPNPSSLPAVTALYMPVIQKVLNAPDLQAAKMTAEHYDKLVAWLATVKLGKAKVPAVLRPYQRKAGA